MLRAWGLSSVDLGACNVARVIGQDTAKTCLWHNVCCTPARCPVFTNKKEIEMKHILIIGVLMAITGCATVEGFGQDVSAASRKVSNAVN
jgi:predicted small secreted protein